MRKILVAAAASAVIAAPAAIGQEQEDGGAVTIIHAGTLLAEPGERPREDMSILIEGDRIVSIEDGYVDREGARIVDLSDAFVLPGLIDSHVHLTSQLGPGARLKAVENSDADWTVQGALYGRRTLEAGFTTVQDVGARGNDAIFALREASEQNELPLPRIRAAGKVLSVTGGHGDGRHGYSDAVAAALHDESICDGADDCRRAARDQIRQGADLIKIAATGGVLSNTMAGLNQQFTDAELDAIVSAAESMGRYVTAHAHGKNGIDAALEAGVASIEHGTYLDEESIALFKENGAYLVPTLLAGDFVARMAEDADWMTDAQRAKSLKVGPQMLGMLRRAHEGGVKIAFGTDSGVSAHGDNAQEFPLMVEAGMTPEEAIVAATVNGADHVEMAEEIGTIEAGKYADIIAVDGDPLADIGELLDVDFVMKDGVVYKETGPQ